MAGHRDEDEEPRAALVFGRLSNGSVRPNLNTEGRGFVIKRIVSTCHGRTGNGRGEVVGDDESPYPRVIARRRF